MAGMTRGALYWHFANKEALYAAMLERVSLPLLETELMAEDLDDPFEALERFADQVLERIAQNEQIWRIHVIIMLRREQMPSNAGMSELERELRSRIAKALEECFRRAEALGILRAGVPPARAARGFQSQLIGLIYVSLQDPDAFRLYADGLEMIRDLLAGYRAG